MKEIAKKIYENNLYLYSFGFASALFFLFLAYRDLSDFITREAVVGYSLLTVILTAGLVINEFENFTKKVSKEEKTEQNSSNEKLNQRQNIQTENIYKEEEDETEVIYEWDEEDELEAEITTTPEHINPANPTIEDKPFG